MKKIALGVSVFLASFFVLGEVVSAMAINGPNGTQVSGWFKDSFTVQIAHGNPTCLGIGTAFIYTYTSGNDHEGQHHYAFYGDGNDNPYLSYDNGPFQPLDMRCPPVLGGSGSLSKQREFDASIDAQPPYVTITDPNGSASTTASSYKISGFAGDTGSGIKQLQAMVNGVAGAFTSVSGTTYSITVPLRSGNNTVQMVATDVVGHTGTSNSITIQSGSTTSGGGNTSGGTTSGGSSGSGTSGGTTPSPSPSPASGSSGSSSQNSSNGSSDSTSSKPQVVKFNQQQLLNLKDADDSLSDPADVQATAALAGATGKTYNALVLTITILFLLCAFVIWRFRPVFAELDRDRSGLRRRIIILVTLPSLLPLLGLGFLGYQQLSGSVKNSLSSQLEKAAQTSALKLDREFNIRRTIIIKTSSDILQIREQYASQRDTLNTQKNKCAAIVKTSIPRGQSSTVTSSDDCLPFLTGFAQLANTSGATVTSYLNALDQGADLAIKDSTAQENQRVDELLGSARHYFPDLLELQIVDASKDATVRATLPRTNPKQPPLTAAHSDLLKSATTDYLALFDNSTSTRQLLLTYPVRSGNQNLGGAVAAFDTEHKDFIPSIWSSTPKPYASDQVYFVTTAGELVTPKQGTPELTGQLKALSGTSASKVYNMKLASQTLATRTSPVNNTNWVVAVGAPASSVLAPLAGIQRTALLAIFGFLLLSILLGIVFVSSIASEIERLVRGAVNFAKGDLDYRIALSSHDELQVLGETMNQMAADIKTAQTQLIEKDKEFINIATHELKAPMTSIIGNLSMITDDGMGQVDDTARKLIDQAYNGTVRLRDIVTDMLDIARLESGHAEFKPEELDITSLTKELVDMQAIPAQQSNVTMTYQPAADTPQVLADKKKLQIIITNFISNAIKYNRPGGTVTISHSEKDGKLVTSVADTGLGIPDDQKDHIFEKFFRVSHEDRADVPGTGLGMHITKRFIEAMGGEVWFESVHGQGTTFSFSLPLASAAQPAPVSVAEAA